MLRITASSLADSFGERYELALADGSQRNADGSNASSACTPRLAEQRYEGETIMASLRHKCCSPPLTR